MKSARFAELAAMTAPVFLRKTPGLGARSEFFLHPAVALDDHITALGDAERFLEFSKVIELGAARMLERLEPRRMHEIRHLDPVDHDVLQALGQEDGFNRSQRQYCQERLGR